MKTLKQVLLESFASVYILTEADKRFIASFGTPDKPVSLAEFLKFWDSLDEFEKAEVLMGYEPEKNPGTEGFNERG